MGSPTRGELLPPRWGCLRPTPAAAAGGRPGRPGAGRRSDGEGAWPERAESQHQGGHRHQLDRVRLATSRADHRHQQGSA
ncbi:MAG: hypothetical protein ACK5GZ_06015 [Cyanobium sp.]